MGDSESFHVMPAKGKPAAHDMLFIGGDYAAALQEEKIES